MTGGDLFEIKLIVA